MTGELYQIYANKTAINEKLAAIKSSGFSWSYHYWSSRENSSDYESSVTLSNGNIYNDDKRWINYVLGFLALEV